MLETVKLSDECSRLTARCRNEVLGRDNFYLFPIFATIVFIFALGSFWLQPSFRNLTLKVEGRLCKRLEMVYATLQDWQASDVVHTCPVQSKFAVMLAFQQKRVLICMSKFVMFMW